VRARDARRYLDGSAEELSLGEGDVPYDDVIDALDEIEYERFLLIARAPQEEQREVIESARDFLRKYE
jgi:sugar phosphate isomerase/epimerase